MCLVHLVLPRDENERKLTKADTQSFHEDFEESFAKEVGLLVREFAKAGEGIEGRLQWSLITGHLSELVKGSGAARHLAGRYGRHSFRKTCGPPRVP